jgi:hypothetical protein
MRPQRLVGLIIILASLILILSARHWYATRIFVPLDQPISLAQGHIATPEFKTNFSGDYYVYIKFDRNYAGHTPCQPEEILRTNWALSRDGRITDTSVTSAPPWVGKADGTVIGSFLGRLELRSGTYRINLNVLSDSGCLNHENPRLRIENYQEQVHDSYFAAFWILLFTLISGALLVIRSFVRNETAPHRSLSITGTDSFESGTLARCHNPHRKASRFSQIPSFGLIASLTLLMILIPMWIISAWFDFTHESRGVWVYIPKMQPTIEIPAKDDFPVLRLEGKGNEIAFFVNSKPVTNHEVRDALDSALQTHNARFVYLAVDPELHYGDAALGIGIIRSVKAEVILYTPNMGGPEFAQPKPQPSRPPKPVK